MDCLITVKVAQDDALQTIMDLQALGYDLVHFDVGSLVVPITKKEKAVERKAPVTRWWRGTRVRLVKIPHTRSLGSAVVVLRELGIGWEGEYGELREIVREKLNTTPASARSYIAYIKNAKCLEVLK
jgi:hypothetical protein